MNIFKAAPVALTALALVACQTEAPADLSNDLPLEQAPPPGAGGLELAVTGALIPGNSITFRVTGAQPNEVIRLVYGSDSAPASFCPPPLNGLCLDVQGARLLPFTLTADASGRGQRTITVPNLPAGREAWFQAATPGATAATSNVIPKYNPFAVGDARRELGVIIAETATVVPGSTYDGTRSEIYFNTTNGLDACIVDIAGSSTSLGTLPPCANCDWAFNVSYTTGRDGSVSGSCVDILGFDPATAVTPFEIGWGYDEDYNVPGYGVYQTVMIYDTTAAAWTWGVAGAGIWDGVSELDWAILTGSYYTY